MYDSPRKIANWKTEGQFERSTNIMSSSRNKAEQSIPTYRSIPNIPQIKVKAKLSFGVTRQRYNHRVRTEPDFNHIKIHNIINKKITKQTDIQETIKEINLRKSTQSHKAVQAYSVATVKGRNSIMNTHQVTIFLGQIKHIMLIEAYRGNFASSFIKKELPLELLRRYQENTKSGCREDLGTTLKQVYKLCQDRLSRQQKERRDSSGCSALSVLITLDSIYVGNCGISQAFCLTKLQSLMRMSKCHNTQNPEELDRVVEEGGRLYRTGVNLSYKKQIQMLGPVRVYPSGTTITRGLGYPCNEKLIIPQPETLYISHQDTKWILLLSSTINDLLSPSEMQKILEGQIKKLSLSYTLHDIAQTAAHKIMCQAVRNGLKYSGTLVLIFTAIDSFVGKEEGIFHRETSSKGETSFQNQPKSVRSFRYAGERKSFFRQSKNANV